MPLKHTVQEMVLENGVRGLLIHVDDAPAFHYEIHFRAGYNTVEEPMQPQTAHVIEHILNGWTTDNRFPTKIAYMNELYKNGAWTNAITDMPGTWHLGGNVNREWRRIMDLRKIAISKPLFSDASLAAEKGNASDEMRSNISNYERLARELVMQAFNKNGQSSQQKIDSIPLITLSDVQSFYDRTYTLNNMRFIVAGNLNKRAEIKEYFSSWDLPVGERIELIGGEYADLSHLSFVHVPHIPNVFTQLAIGIPRRLTTIECESMKLLNRFLFNVANAKVNQEVRKRGICYRMYAEIHGRDKGSVWNIGAPVSPDNLSAVSDLYREWMQYVCDGNMTEQEFSSVLDYSKGKFELSGQTVEELVGLHHDSYFDEGIIIPSHDEATLFGGITREGVQQLANEFLSSGRWLLTGVGSATLASYETERDKFAKFMDGR